MATTAGVFAGDEFLVQGGTIRVAHKSGNRLRVVVTPDGYPPCPMKLPRGSRVEVLPDVWVEWLGMRPKKRAGKRVPVVRVTSPETIGFRPNRAA